MIGTTTALIISASMAAASAAAKAKAAKSAANTQAKATDRAANLQASSTRESQAYTQQAMAPYMSLGQFGMGLLTQPGPGPMRGPTSQMATPAPIPQLPGQMEIGGRAQGAPQTGWAPPQPRTLADLGVPPEVAAQMAAQAQARQGGAGGGYSLAQMGRAPQGYWGA